MELSCTSASIRSSTGCVCACRCYCNSRYGSSGTRSATNREPPATLQPRFLQAPCAVGRGPPSPRLHECSEPVGPLGRSPGQHHSHSAACPQSLSTRTYTYDAPLAALGGSGPRLLGVARHNAVARCQGCSERERRLCRPDTTQATLPRDQNKLSMRVGDTRPGRFATRCRHLRCHCTPC